MEWIKVTERLPESECTVLGLYKRPFGGYACQVVDFEPETIHFEASFKNFECVNVTQEITHWQPLPEFPNE